MSAKKTTKAKATKAAPKTKAATKKPQPEVSQPAKPTKAKSASKKAETKTKKVSALDAAAKVLAAAGEPMNCKQMIEVMTTKGYWTSPGGQTPHATLYSAILREMTTKGKEARFVKTERGHFKFAG